MELLLGRWMKLLWRMEFCWKWAMIDNYELMAVRSVYY